MVAVRRIINAPKRGVGAATDEYTREGISGWKRNRLVQAGADVIVPEFRQWPQLVAYLMAEEPYGGEQHAIHRV